jgi:Predicted ATPase involved in replication control, Cdc46/Mcm family
MVDTQRLVIEESPDSLEGGEQPRRINAFLKEDLVDPKMEERTTPGSKVRLYGILKEVPGTELEFVIMVIAVSCVKLLSAHNSTQHTSRKHKV